MHTLCASPCQVYSLQPCLPELWHSDEESIAFVTKGSIALQVWLTSGVSSSAWTEFSQKLDTREPLTFCATLPPSGGTEEDGSGLTGVRQRMAVGRRLGGGWFAWPVPSVTCG